MSAYSKALRNLAETLEAHPEWPHEDFHADGDDLLIHTARATARAFIRAVGGQWKSQRYGDEFVTFSSKSSVLGSPSACFFAHRDWLR